jgi:hypothetical protein
MEESRMSDKHRLELAGYNALLAEHCALVDQVAVLTTRVEQMAVELRRLGCTVSITQEIVVDLGHGWQIVRELDEGYTGGSDAATTGLDRDYAAGGDTSMDARRGAAGTAPNAGC